MNPLSYLFISISLSTGIFLLFQAFKLWNIDSLKAIVINYGVAGSLGWWLAGGTETFHRAWESDPRWVGTGLAAGGLFIYLFQLIAKSAQENGITVTSISAKLSMVIPVAIFLLFDPGDTVTLKKMAAIGLSIPAIVLSSWKPEQTKKEKKLAHSNGHFRRKRNDRFHVCRIFRTRVHERGFVSIVVPFPTTEHGICNRPDLAHHHPQSRAKCIVSKEEHLARRHFPWDDQLWIALLSAGNL
ncbi:cilia- and flagella-associated protein 77 [Flavobacteriales bacterium]|nr:cilia- and flagella-associated protein 77 [Flavobacteriales bacterium]